MQAGRPGMPGTRKSDLGGLPRVGSSSLHAELPTHAERIGYTALVKLAAHAPMTAYQGKAVKARMSRSTLATVAAWALAAVMAGPLAAAPAGEHVALFKSVSGSVTVVRSSGPVTATAGMPLYVADRLVSAADATAGIMFKDGTAVTLGPASEIELRDYVFEPKDARYQFDVYLLRGKAVYASGKIGKLSPESVKVGTPTATVGVRGTRFIVEAE